VPQGRQRHLEVSLSTLSRGSPVPQGRQRHLEVSLSTLSRGSPVPQGRQRHLEVSLSTLSRGSPVPQGRQRHLEVSLSTLSRGSPVPQGRQRHLVAVLRAVSLRLALAAHVRSQPRHRAPQRRDKNLFVAAQQTRSGHIALWELRRQCRDLQMTNEKETPITAGQRQNSYTLPPR
jgi:hypothetical protein